MKGRYVPCNNCSILGGCAVSEIWKFTPGLKNRFDSEGFAKFWLRVEQECAEQEKKSLYYPDQACPYCGKPECLGDCQQAEAEMAQELGEDPNW